MNHASETPLVTICCDTYNQEAYLASALDGFVMQQTDFPFEILIHDDASTDRTPEIIRAYEKRYPDLFRCVFRSENIYSKDRKIFEHYMFPLARGKYIALCEGDDCWISPHKLQRQIDWMESHPDCTLCVCGAELRDKDDKAVGTVCPYETDTDVPMEDVILGGGGFVATASIVTLTRLAQSRAAFCEETEIDDAPLQLWFAQNGSIRYLSEQMCAYRVAVPGSWTEEYFAADRQKRIRVHENMIRMLRAFDEETQGRWHDAVERVIASQHAYQILFMQNDVRALSKPPFREQFLRLPLRRRVRMLLVRLGLLPDRHRYR